MRTSITISDFALFQHALLKRERSQANIALDGDQSGNTRPRCCPGAWW